MHRLLKSAARQLVVGLVLICVGVPWLQHQSLRLDGVTSTAPECSLIVTHSGRFTACPAGPSSTPGNASMHR